MAPNGQFLAMEFIRGDKLEALLARLGAEVMGFDLTPDGQTLISVGRDGMVRLWGTGE